MPAEFQREYPAYCQKAIAQCLRELSPGPSVFEQIRLFVIALNEVTGGDEAYDMTLISLADTPADEFGQDQISSLYAFFAGAEPSQCAYGASAFFAAIKNLSGETLLRKAVELLLAAKLDTTADGAVHVGDTVYAIDVCEYD